MTAGLFPLIHLGRVWVFYYIIPYPSQRQLWPNFISPLVWDVCAISTYLTVSVIFWYVGLIPDLAAARDRCRSRARARTIRARGSTACCRWAGRGAGSQWRHYGRGVPLLRGPGHAAGGLGALGRVLGLRHGASCPAGTRRSSPPYFVAGAIHSGLAMVLTLLIPMRRLLHLERVITSGPLRGRGADDDRHDADRRLRLRRSSRSSPGTPATRSSGSSPAGGPPAGCRVVYSGRCPSERAGRRWRSCSAGSGGASRRCSSSRSWSTSACGWSGLSSSSARPRTTSCRTTGAPTRPTLGGDQHHGRARSAFFLFWFFGFSQDCCRRCSLSDVKEELGGHATQGGNWTARPRPAACRARGDGRDGRAGRLRRTRSTLLAALRGVRGGGAQTGSRPTRPSRCARRSRILGRRPSPVRFWTLVGRALGLVGGFCAGHRHRRWSTA